MLKKTSTKKKYTPNAKEKYMCAKHKKFFTTELLSWKKDIIKANNLGNLLKGSDRIDESENNYKKAIKIKPDYLEAYLNLCELLEKTNRLDDVLITVNNAKKALLHKSSDIMFFEALIHFRQENFLSTEKLIEKIKDNNISNTRKANFFKFKAEWFQLKKNFDTAFGYFMSMNNFVKNSISYKKQNPEQFFNKTKGLIVIYKGKIIKKLYLAQGFD